MANSAKIDSSSGRMLWLYELRQSLTYEGYLEGLPTIERNRVLVEELIAKTSREFGTAKPYLVQPIETPDNRYREGKPYPYGTPSSLPWVICIGRFESSPPVRDQNCDTSGLVIIWFQNDFAFPIDPKVLDQIKAIDWDTHASDFYCC